jgi:hypothetical protein
MSRKSLKVTSQLDSVQFINEISLTEPILQLVKLTRRIKLAWVWFVRSRALKKAHKKINPKCNRNENAPARLSRMKLLHTTLVYSVGYYESKILWFSCSDTWTVKSDPKITHPIRASRRWHNYSLQTGCLWPISICWMNSSFSSLIYSIQDLGPTTNH